MLKTMAHIGSWQRRMVVSLAALSPLLLAADCRDGGSSDGVISLIYAIVDLVLSIISLT